MTKDDILNNSRLLKRFCSDTGIPINIFEQPYFTQRIKILDPIFRSEEKLNQFFLEMERWNTDQDYFEYYNQTKNQIIQDIKSNPAWQRFNNSTEDNNKEETNTMFNYSAKDCYSMLLDDKDILSIDMKKANFSALRCYDPEIFDGAETWEKFLSRYTDRPHILQSKYIRQVIMGACNPKRQVRYEKSIMRQLLTFLLLNSDRLEPYSLSNDEIILMIPETVNPYRIYQEVTTLVNMWKHGQIMRVNLIHLNKLPVTDGWMRKIFDGTEHKTDFKKLNADYYHQAVKWLYKEPVTEDDLVIKHDRQLARLLKPLFKIK